MGRRTEFSRVPVGAERGADGFMAGLAGAAPSYTLPRFDFQAFLSVESGYALPDKTVIMKDTISEIEERIRNAGALKDENRAELLDLLGQLKSQIGALSKTNQEQAQSIAGFTEVSAHEATREERNPKSLKHSLLGLQSSVHELEQSHPQLVGVVDRIATMLASMGI